MNIDVPVRDLGEIDIAPLVQVLNQLDDDAWRANKVRQEAFDVHSSTESVVMLFVSLEAWPDLVVSQEPGYVPLKSVAVPMMEQLIDRSFEPGGRIIRAMAAKLLPGARINTHVDLHPSFHCGHRVHIPLKTHRKVRFSVDGRPHRFDVGRAYEINNQLPHSVMNGSDEDRIHFIFDYVPPDRLTSNGKALK